MLQVLTDILISVQRVNGVADMAVCVFVCSILICYVAYIFVLRYQPTNLPQITLNLPANNKSYP